MRKFKNFDKQASAAASLGQVHFAEDLKSNKKFELEIDNYKDEKPKRRLLKKL